ncbi:pili assembly chaperone [Burkholderia sp. WAC0059]|nr:pili assembly chaperone [Burkholderia sp. WAC0059]
MAVPPVPPAQTWGAATQAERSAAGLAPAATASPAAPLPAAAEAAQAEPAATPAAQAWKIEISDGTIKGVMDRWAQSVGWQFVWDVPIDFPVDATATIHGSFEDALNKVVAALQHSQVPIQVILYKGNKVLRVVPEGAG